jgi:hypothetical protein
MIGEIDLSTARRLQTTLNHMSPQGRRYLIDVPRDTVRRSARHPTKRRRSRSAGLAPYGPRSAVPSSTATIVAMSEREAERRMTCMGLVRRRLSAPVLPGVGWFADRNQWHGRQT